MPGSSLQPATPYFYLFRLLGEIVVVVMVMVVVLVMGVYYHYHLRLRRIR
jgi:hypothetical protein